MNDTKNHKFINKRCNDKSESTNAWVIGDIVRSYNQDTIGWSGSYVECEKCCMILRFYRDNITSCEDYIIKNIIE